VILVSYLICMEEVSTSALIPLLIFAVKRYSYSEDFLLRFSQHLALLLASLL
jgi:hypothetical protein